MVVVVFIIIFTVAMMGFKYILYRGIDKVEDSITNAVDKKLGKMNETEPESLADRLNNK